MKNRLWKTLTAVVMAGMMMGTMAMGVSAEEGGSEGGTTVTPPTTVTITKEIEKGENVYAPKTDFTFSVAPGTAVDGANPIYAGPSGGVSFQNGTKSESMTSAPKASDIGQTTITVDTLDLQIDRTKFTAPGVYRYVVSEESGEYEGLTYTTETKYFDVYVNSNLEVYSYTFVDPENPKVKDDGVFTNNYDKTGENGLNNLIVVKKVDGTQGDKTKEFTFTVTVTGVSGEQYYVTFSDKTNPITLTSGSPQTFSLSNDETATIYGLSNSDSYVVTETDYSSDGYTTTIDDTETRRKEGVIQTDTTVTVVNTRNAATPTGIVMNIAPYILMVVVAGALAFVFLRKRNYNAD